MAPPTLAEKASAHLQRLCRDIDSRRVGSAGNRLATDFFACIASSFGFEIATPTFDCIDWIGEGVTLSVADQPFEALISPYSLGCRVQAPLATVSTLEALESAEVGDRILLLQGGLTAGQLMPKNFPFYNPDEHKRIIALLEARRPLAIIAATARDPEMVGSGVYPFPLIEDGDFDIPSVYMTDEEGARLAGHVGREVRMESRARRIPATGCNVIATKVGRWAKRVVVFAHIDARMGSPGASDNASGTIVLLLLAELLAGYTGGLGIELVAMNGEDYFSSPGEKQWLAHNAGRFSDILLGINIDDVGYRNGRVAYSMYDCPAEIASVVHQVVAPRQGLVEGEPWYQGDHGLYLINQIPALALTSEALAELMGGITHTPRDTPEIIDPARLVEVAEALADLLLRLNELSEDEGQDQP